ncbi:MAG TPA: UTP--glucose-1-phosphate uridylyltransferase GalU [bacterium]|nr:UTP--glucose-1-phosphate uridylyltransferase GalU [bacterium]
MKGSRSITQAVLPVAGLGTRFLPATKAIPKEMLPIVDKPTVQLVVEEAAGAGIRDIIFITGRGKGEIEDHFDITYELEDTLAKRGKRELLGELKKIDEMIRIIGVRQKQALGLGHAVGMAGGLVQGEAFAVMLGDDLVDSEVPCIEQLARVYDKYKCAVVAVMKVPPSEVNKYGIVAGEPIEKGLTRVRTMVEKPDHRDAPGDLAVIGRYILPSRVFGLIGATRPGKGGEIQLTDALQALAADGGPGGGVIACEFQGRRYDAGDKVGYLEANLAWALKHPDMRKGVIELCQRFAKETP